MSSLTQWHLDTLEEIATNGMRFSTFVVNRDKTVNGVAYERKVDPIARLVASRDVRSPLWPGEPVA